MQRNCRRILQQGFTLLEMLLVLAIAASLITVSVRFYRQYQQRVLLMQVKANVSTLYQALQQYYFATGCDATFLGSLTPAISGLPKNTPGVDLPEAMLPIVSNYSVAIIDTGKQASGKTIYALRINAVISDQAPLSAAQYAALLHAGFVDGQTIAWQLLPSMDPNQSAGALWLLNARRQGFKSLVSAGQDGNCIG